MLYITKDVAVTLNHFKTAKGAEALQQLAELILNVSTKTCTLAEGNELLRAQGEVRIANWLLNLPKGLSDASNAADAESVG